MKLCREGASIYSYVKACQHLRLLISHVVHVHWLPNLECGLVGISCAGFASDLLVHGDPAVRYVIATIAIEV